MTSLENELPATPVNGELKLEESNDSSDTNKSDEQLLFCEKCKLDFDNYGLFHEHLIKHISQPTVVLQRVDKIRKKKIVVPRRFGSLKVTVKTTNNNFKIIKSTGIDDFLEDSPPRIPKLRIILPEIVNERKQSPKEPAENSKETPCNGDNSEKMVELHSLPSESQSPSFPAQSPAQPDTGNIINETANNFWKSASAVGLPITQSGEKEAETHNDLLQNFLNDVEKASAKETHINSNETEYISLEHLAEKSSPHCQCPVCGERCLDEMSLDVHQKAMGHFVETHSLKPSSKSNSAINANVSSASVLVPYGQPPLGVNTLGGNPLDSLANLPMLAQQVNRLQQQQGVHQQNVLINIQQFGQTMAPPPPPPPYGRPAEMPPPYGNQPFVSQQPQSHMYPGYHGPPPQPAHAHPHHPMYYPPTSHGLYPIVSQANPYVNQAYVQSGMMPPQRESLQPPQMMPRPQQRMAPSLIPTGHQVRPRIRMASQPRGPRMSAPRASATAVSQARAPGVPTISTSMRLTLPQQVRPQKRSAPPPEPAATTSTTTVTPPKRKRLDVFLPDTNDNDDCHVISMQKCNDGLPVIKNVQGGTSSTATDPVMHLTDSITLSVRNPKEVSISQQKKNDAKSVANILATRGITVTPTAKNGKDSISVPNKPVQKSTSPPIAINLNNAVSIIPTARSTNSQQSKEASVRPPRPPTVDLTDDDPVQIQPAVSTIKSSPAAAKKILPYQCDLCPAQYPSLQTLQTHRRNYHKTGIQNELAIPIIDFRQTSVLNKLTSLGIQNFIPLPQLDSGSGTFGIPIISMNNARNPNVCNLSAIGSDAVLPLGPIRYISNK